VLNFKVIGLIKVFQFSSIGLAVAWLVSAFSQASTKSLPDNSESPPSTCEELKGQLDEQQKRIDALEAAVAHLAKKVVQCTYIV